MKNKFCILFAGAVGSSKTPIANYLSGKLGLPIFNTDAIRTEVLEDLGIFDQDIYLKRRNERLQEVLINDKSFILDASIDREWSDNKKFLSDASYDYFIISLDLSDNLLRKLYTIKGYTDSLPRLNQLAQEHRAFLDQFNNEVAVHIDDINFNNRLAISLGAIKNWIGI